MGHRANHLSIELVIEEQTEELELLRKIKYNIFFSNIDSCMICRKDVKKQILPWFATPNAYFHQ